MRNTTAKPVTSELPSPRSVGCHPVLRYDNTVTAGPPFRAAPAGAKPGTTSGGDAESLPLSPTHSPPPRHSEPAVWAKNLHFVFRRGSKVAMARFFDRVSVLECGREAAAFPPSLPPAEGTEGGSFAAALQDAARGVGGTPRRLALVERARLRGYDEPGARDPDRMGGGSRFAAHRSAHALVTWERRHRRTARRWRGRTSRVS